jgi:hypothetical protein
VAEPNTKLERLLTQSTNFGGFFSGTSANQYWVYGASLNNISANANTFIAPVLEGGVNGLYLVDNSSQGSLNITGGSIEGVSGSALTLQGTKLPSAITGTHFEANKGADIVLQGASNIRISAIFSDKLIALHGDTRNVTISDSVADSISIDYVSGKIQSTPSGAKRIILQNISTCLTGTQSITPAPTNPFVPGPSQSPDPSRPDIIYTNIGLICGGF